MEADDPRHAWAAQNNAALQQRAQAEASKKVEMLAKAKEYLEKVNKVGCDRKGVCNSVTCCEAAWHCAMQHRAVKRIWETPRTS
jgi:hypothetical protein